jgi:hypothetical protein
LAGFTPVKYAIAFNRASRITWIFFAFLPSLMEGRKFNPWPRPLAQTWHAKIESHSSCLLILKR